VSGEVCPKCGVAVVPGYVKCPKCHFPLPPPRRGRNSIAPSGTAVQSTRAPIGAIILVVALVGGAIAAYFAVRPHHEATAAPDESKPSVMSEPSSGAPAGPALAPAAPAASAATPDESSGPSAATLATELQHALDRQRLWSTVEVTGSGVEVRSSSCSDAAMRPVVDAAAPRFKAAGIRRLRCLEESGTVVFARDL
jgi:hypothetical protein